jgi:hypothetical protein
VSDHGEREDGTNDEHERDIDSDLSLALKEMRKALPRYRKAESYAEGMVSEKFLSASMKKMLSGSDTEFYVNFSQRVVSAVLDRMEISSVTAEPLDADLAEEEDNEGDDDTSVTGDEDDGDDENDERNNLTDTLISLVWDRNELDIEAPEINEKTLNYGDAYVLVWESDDDGSDDDGPAGVDIFYNSPLTTRIIYDDEQPRKKKLAIKQWDVGDESSKRTRVNLYYPEGTYKLITKHGKQGMAAIEYEVYVDEYTDDAGFVENPWGIIPIFHFRTARPYGRPEHEQTYGAQDAIIKLIRNQMEVSDFAAFPQRVALQDSNETAGTDETDDWGDGQGGPGGDPERRQSTLKAGPGKMWFLDYIRDIKEFTPADVDQLLKPLSFYIGAMGAISGTPVSYFGNITGITPGANTRGSGESQRQDKDPLVSKIKARQRSLSATWKDVLEFAMLIIDHPAQVNITWAPIQTVDGVDGWKAVQEQQRAGVPVRQSLLEAGYTEPQVDAFGYTEEHPDGEPGQGPADDEDDGMPPPMPQELDVPAPGAIGAGPVPPDFE